MKILAIETSCDETSIAIIGKIVSLENKNTYKVLAHNTISQINIHAQYGGVYPMLAKREHEKNLMPLLHKSLEEAGLIENKISNLESNENVNIIFDGEIEEFLERYPVMRENILDFFTKFEIKKSNKSEGENKSKYDIDYIAVTSGPGLPPALWVGVNFAKVISKILNNIPIYPINHMEGHIVGGLSNLITKEKIIFRDPECSSETFKGGPENNIFYEIIKPIYPALSFLISGGHTELVLSERENHYQKIGETLDDAVGESYDKVARMLGLEYPGGPKVAMLAKEGRSKESIESKMDKPFPRPMMHSQNLDFSFSGLKTHILYFIRDCKKQIQDKLYLLNPSLNATLEHSESLKNNLSESANLSEEIKIKIATEFEYAVRDVFVKKLAKAIFEYNIKTLIVGGGVASNDFLRENFMDLAEKLNIKIYISEKSLSTDNALMIALTAATHIESGIGSKDDFIATGSLSF